MGLMEKVHKTIETLLNQSRSHIRVYVTNEYNLLIAIGCLCCLSSAVGKVGLTIGFSSHWQCIV